MPASAHAGAGIVASGTLLATEPFADTKPQGACPMDVHAPMEPIHSWRDIALHLGIVTVGLFIALSLEGLVEHIHNRHLVAEARANIRQELEDNHKAAQQDLVYVQKSIDLQKANIQTIHHLQDNPKNFHGSVSNTIEFNSLEDAAWRTARDTGALSFMPYDEVQRYSDLYKLEDDVNEQETTTEQSDLLAAAPFDMGVDPSNLPADEYTRMLRDNASVEIQLFGLKQFVQQFDDQCLADLKK
jgi:hypothetical protein